LIQEFWFRRYRAHAPPANAVFRALLQKSATPNWIPARFLDSRVAAAQEFDESGLSARPDPAAQSILIANIRGRSAAARAMPVCIKSRRKGDRRPRLREGVDHLGSIAANRL
jgi:hypothetical protein